MANFTRATAGALDATRRALGQNKLKLTLLKLAAGAGRGYTTISPIKSGWLILQNGRNNPVELFITESKQVTAAMLKDTRAIALDGKVYKITGAEREEPFGTGLRLWSFEIKPSPGETFPG